MNSIHFYFNLYFVYDIIMKIISKGAASWDKSIDKIDVILTLANFAIIIYERSIQLPLYESSEIGLRIKSLNIFRILRIMYKAKMLALLRVITKSLI